MADTATEERIEAVQTGGEKVPPAAEQAEEGAATAASDAAAPAGSGRADEVESAAGVEERKVVDLGAERESPANAIEFLSNIELQAAVELGRTTLSIGEVLALGPGSLVQLDKMLGDPVELMIKDRLIARGEVVVVDDRFGLRVTEILSRGPTGSAERGEE